jgi:hypothetical protein
VLKLTINITKAKLMKWVVIIVILVCGAAQATDAPKAAVNVVRHREFLAEFSGYDDYSLLDVYEWRPGLFGVVMMDTAGIRMTLVYDCRDGKREVIYRDAYIPNKKKREELRRESLLVSDAIKLAVAAVNEETTIKKNETLSRY